MGRALARGGPFRIGEYNGMKYFFSREGNPAKTAVEPVICDGKILRIQRLSQFISWSCLSCVLGVGHELSQVHHLSDGALTVMCC